MADVLFDGQLIGTVSEPARFTAKLRELRRASKASPFINVYYDNDSDTVHIFLERDRLRRPLIVVKNKNPLLTRDHLEQLKAGKISWSNLINSGVIEYLDAAEEENCLIALQEEDLTSEHTHLEIDPISMLGMSTALVPYANFSPSSRLLRGQKTQKQGLGCYATNYPMRMDTNINILHYPQRPIVGTFVREIFGEERSAGQNIVVAVMNFEGYNMEDAVVFNKQSIQRGCGRSTHYRPYIAERLRYPGGQIDEIKIPDKDVQGYLTEEDYRFLGEDGIIFPELEVKGGDVLVGKVSPPRFLSKLETFSTAANILKDTSIRVRANERGVVDDVIVTENGEGDLLVKVRVRETRDVEIGDKYSTRTGQKGVVGIIVAGEDLPFTADGVTPDIIFSPNSLLKRMTINYMIEALAGKVGALGGRYIDGTPFSSESADSLRKALLALGFRDDGVELLYDGKTGEAYPARIFVGNTFYLRLFHQVADKIQARARGPVQLLTRQPTAGKAKEGGMRLGEMEKETLVGHGSSLLIKERFDSDKVVCYVCKKCGDIAMYNYYKKRAECVACEGKTKTAPIELSYAFKLFIDELKSLCINPRLILKSKY